MSPRTGRPKISDPKSNDIKVRVDDETLRLLDLYCSDNKLSRAEAIRKGIHMLLAERK